MLPDALRITLELEHEVPFYDERIEGPPRVFVDLHNTRAVEALKDAALNFPDDVVRQIRVGRQQDARTRVVLDIQGAARHSVYALYNPYRIVLDFERLAPTRDAAAPAGARRTTPSAEAIAQPGEGCRCRASLGSASRASSSTRGTAATTLAPRCAGSTKPS